jgi:hypothetical protein
MSESIEVSASGDDCRASIPLPIVRLNRVTIVVGVVLAYVLHAPLITTALFVIVALAAAFGRRASLVYQVGTRVLPTAGSGPEGEDPSLMRFNNALAALFLGVAQLAFALYAPLVGWIFAGFKALAAVVALAGFCFGCYLFYQFKLNRSRLFGS